MADRAEDIRRLLASASVQRADAHATPSDEPLEWSAERLAGRLIELCGVGAAASLTAAIQLVLDAQRGAEPVAWVTLPHSTFYPPDVHDAGVDLEALAIVRAPSSQEAARAADRLLRSGAFGLVVLDLGKSARIPIAMQGRLVGLAQKHDSAIVCITEKSAEAPSLGSMVSLRAEVVRDSLDGARFRCQVKVLKDKRRGPGWSHTEVRRGPAGLR